MSTKIQINSYEGITLKTKDKYCTDDLAISLKEDLIPRGTYPISDNGEYDIANYETVFVNVNKNIPSGQIEITGNGEYNIATLESVIVNVTEPEDSFVKYYYKTNKLVITAKDLSDIRVNTFENVYKLY